MMWLDAMDPSPKVLVALVGGVPNTLLPVADVFAPSRPRAPGPMAPHSVLTINLKEDGPTKAAEQRVLAFFRERTGAG